MVLKARPSSTSSESSGENEEYGLRALSCKPPQPKRNYSGTEYFIPSDILMSQQPSAIATRMKITPAKHATYTKAFIDTVGGETSKVCNTKQFRITPKYLTSLWDGKLMPQLRIGIDWKRG